MRVSIFPTVSAQSIEPYDVAWSDLVACCIDPPVYPSKRDCPLIKLAHFGDRRTNRGALRHDDNVAAVSGLEGDYDAGIMSPEMAAALLQWAGIEAVVYTSPSHTFTAPRWRVLAPLSIEHPPAMRRDLLARLNGALGGVLAAESFTLSQTYYVGRVTGVEYAAHRIHGTTIDLLPDLAAIYPIVAHREQHGERRTDANLDELADALRHVPADDYHEWVAVGQALACLGNDGFALWSEWSATSAKHDGEADLQRWGTFTGDRTGFAAIFARAQRAGWVNPAARKELDLAGVGFGADVSRAATGAASTFHAPMATAIEGDRLATGAGLLKVFDGCVYVTSIDSMLVPGGDLLNKSRFNAQLGGYSFMIDPANTIRAKSPWDCFTGSQCFNFPKVNDVCFRPELPPACIVHEAGRTLANIWWPVETARTPGDVSPFLDLLARILPVESDRSILLAYMAAVAQHPGAKFQWCPVIQGGEGNGKSFFGRALEHVVGDRYSHRPKALDITNKFNGWLRGKLLAIIEEIQVSEKFETLEHMKDMITNERLEIQGKGADQVTGDNRANFIMSTNHKDAIPVTVDKRRYAIFYTAQQEAADIMRDGMGGDYFPNLYNWAKSGGYAHIAHYLAQYQIPDALNPAGACHRAPLTSSTDEAIEVSRGPVEQEILEAVGRGDAGFCGGWISSIMLGKLLANRRVSLHRQTAMLRSLGYVLHPALPDGRACHSIVVPDGGRPRLWIKPGHLSTNVASPAEASRMYQAAQGQAMGFGAGVAHAAG